MYILIGNLISFVSACFTVASSWSHSKKRMYLYQGIQCFILALANIAFASYSGTATLVLCAFRNFLVAYDRFTKRLCVIFLVLILAAGIISNTRGVLGYLPVITTVIYTIGCYAVQKPVSVKCNIIFNLILWAIYEVMIQDYVSFIMDTGAAIIALVSIYRIKDSHEIS